MQDNKLNDNQEAETTPDPNYQTSTPVLVLAADKSDPYKLLLSKYRRCKAANKEQHRIIEYLKGKLQQAQTVQNTWKATETVKLAAKMEQ